MVNAFGELRSGWRTLIVLVGMLCYCVSGLSGSSRWLARTVSRAGVQKPVQRSDGLDPTSSSRHDRPASSIFLESGVNAVTAGLDQLAQGGRQANRQGRPDRDAPRCPPPTPHPSARHRGGRNSVVVVDVIAVGARAVWPARAGWAATP